MADARLMSAHYKLQSGPLCGSKHPLGCLLTLSLASEPVCSDGEAHLQAGHDTPADAEIQHVESSHVKKARECAQSKSSSCERVCTQCRPQGPGCGCQAVCAASELVELDGQGHLQVGHDAHADEDAQHDDGIHAHAQPVLDVGWDQARRVRNLHALCKNKRRPSACRTTAAILGAVVVFVPGPAPSNAGPPA